MDNTKIEKPKAVIIVQTRIYKGRVNSRNLAPGNDVNMGVGRVLDAKVVSLDQQIITNEPSVEVTLELSEKDSTCCEALARSGVDQEERYVVGTTIHRQKLIDGCWCTMEDCSWALLEEFSNRADAETFDLQVARAAAEKIERPKTEQTKGSK